MAEWSSLLAGTGAAGGAHKRYRVSARRKTKTGCCNEAVDGGVVKPARRKAAIKCRVVRSQKDRVV
jgi:hypothetical protein